MLADPKGAEARRAVSDRRAMPVQKHRASHGPVLLASSQYTCGADDLPSDATLRVTDAVFQGALASCASPNEVGLSFSAAPTSSSIGWLLAAYDGPQSLSPIKGVDSMESGSGGPLQVGIGSDCPGIVPTSFTIDFTVTPHPTAYH